MNDGYMDFEALNGLPAIFEDDIIRHVQFPKPLTIKIDGKHNKGAVMKLSPENEEEVF